MKGSIYADAVPLKKKYETSDPFELLDAMNAEWKMTQAF